jgi:hypothetical protein
MDLSDLSAAVFEKSEEKSIWERACWEWDVDEIKDSGVVLRNLINDHTLELTLEELDAFPVLYATEEGAVLKNIRSLSLYSGVMHPSYREALPEDVSLPLPFAQNHVRLIKTKDSGTEMYALEPDTPIWHVACYLLEYGTDWRLPVWEYGNSLYITVSGNFSPAKLDHHIVFIRFSENITCFFNFSEHDHLNVLEITAPRLQSAREAEFIQSLQGRSFLTNGQARWLRKICERTSPADTESPSLTPIE